MLKFFQKKKGEKGFTLIELLVVIAIIGVLATIVLVSLNTAREKARDTRRISDMRQVALALGMYYDDNGSYPSGSDTDWADGAGLDSDLEPDYMTNVPTDPGGNTYAYNPCNSDQNYAVGATLEDDNNSNLDNDADNPGCALDPDGSGDSCDDAVSGTGGTDYCIQP